MEFDNKRKKRLTKSELQDGNALKKKLKKPEEEAAPAAVPPEEEVEEFFAILKRIKVAVDYFDQKGRGGKEWREALEQAEFTVDDDDDEDGGDRRQSDGCDAKKSTGQAEAVVSEGFDLNAVAPEAADAQP